jgi:hypothetical protein
MKKMMPIGQIILKKKIEKKMDFYFFMSTISLFRIQENGYTSNTFTRNQLNFVDILYFSLWKNISFFILVLHLDLPWVGYFF